MRARPPEPPHRLSCLPWSWAESGAASAGPDSRWHCISSGPAPSPPLPSAEAPAALACSSELKAKPAVESAALAHWGLIPASGGRAGPTAASRASGAVLGAGLRPRGGRAPTPAGDARAPWRDRAAVGCASLPALVRRCGCARVLPGHVADAHECPRGGFTELLIHVAIGRSDPRCGARSLARVMAARAGRQPEGPGQQNPQGKPTWVRGREFSPQAGLGAQLTVGVRAGTELLQGSAGAARSWVGGKIPTQAFSHPFPMAWCDAAAVAAAQRCSVPQYLACPIPSPGCASRTPACQQTPGPVAAGP